MVPRSGNGVGGGVISLFKGQIWSQARYIETNVPGEKNVLLKALAHSKDVATLKKYLNMTLGNQVACHVKLTQFWIRGRWRTKMCPQSLKQLQPTLLVCPRHCLQFFSSVECSLRSYLSATNTIGKTSHNHFLNFFYNSTVWQCHNGDWSHPFLASSPFYKKNVQSKKLRPAPAKVPLLPGSICANTGLTSSPFLAAVGPWAISSTRSHGAFPPAPTSLRCKSSSTGAMLGRGTLFFDKPLRLCRW